MAIDANKYTLSQLLSAYADNNTGNITPHDLRDGFKSSIGSLPTDIINVNKSVGIDDVFLNVNTSANDIIITLPSANGNDGNGSTYKNKYYSFYNSGDNNIQIIASYINGTSSIIIPPNENITTLSDGSYWIPYNNSDKSDIINDINVIKNTSGNWDNAYSTVSLNSATWNAAGDFTSANSVYSTVNSNSASWNNHYNGTSADSVYTTVNQTSSNWNLSYTHITNNSANYNNTYSVVSTTSGNWNNTYTAVSSNSGNYDNTYIVVSTNSANWDSAYNTLNSTSGALQELYTNVSSSSGNWDNAYSTVSTNSASWNNHYNGTSANSVYTTVNTNSASWTGGGADLTSADSVYTTVNNTSSTWESATTKVENSSSNWDNTYTAVSTNSASWSAGGGGVSSNKLYHRYHVSGVQLPNWSDTNPLMDDMYGNPSSSNSGYQNDMSTAAGIFMPINDITSVNINLTVRPYNVGAGNPATSGQVIPFTVHFIRTNRTNREVVATATINITTLETLNQNQGQNVNSHNHVTSSVSLSGGDLIGTSITCNTNWGIVGNAFLSVDYLE